MVVSGTLRHLSSISHDGKVIFFGVDPAGHIWYSVKRSGFEDSAQAGDPFGFEAWKALSLGVSAPDASVAEDERKNLTDDNGDYLLRSHFDDAELLKTVQAPVQLVSAFGCVYVFRQGPQTARIYVSRFILDGMKNELVPRLEVRFRRSKQRLRAEAPAGKSSDSLAQADSLDFRDIDGRPFFEPTTCLSFIPPTSEGWFTVVCVPTSDIRRSRWQIFAFDVKLGKLVLYTVASTEAGLFDVKDQLVGEPAGEATAYRTAPGIVRRVLNLQCGQDLPVAGAPAATLYDVQSERHSKTGPLLVREASRLMLLVPVQEVAVTVAAISFSVDEGGNLSQIDLTPDTVETLRSRTRELLLPVDRLDKIKALGLAKPPSAGVIVGMQRGPADRLQIRAGAAVEGVAEGAAVQLSGTRSHDGNYKVLAVEGATLTVEAEFVADEVGRWLVVPDQETGLVFDNMVVGYDRTEDGKLKITCTTHDLQVGDDVQLVGVDSVDGLVRVVAVDGAGFVLDTAWRPGEAANLKRVQRRGLVFDGAHDLIETPPLGMSLPNTPSTPFGRTVQAWIKVPALRGRAETIVRGEDGLLDLSLTAANTVSVSVRLSDGTIRSVVDPTPIVAGRWHHFAGTVDYQPAAGGHTRLFLCRDGAKVEPAAGEGEWIEGGDKVIGRETPGHLGASLLAFDGVDDCLQIPNFMAGPERGSFTLELWLRCGGQGLNALVVSLSSLPWIAFSDGRLALGVFWFTAIIQETAWVDSGWHHVAAVSDVEGGRLALYVDGQLVGEFSTRLGPTEGDLSLTVGEGFEGQVADLRMWDHARGADEIRADMLRRLTGVEAGLVGYWPLADQNVGDRSPRKRSFTLAGAPAWKPSLYRLPGVTVSGALEFPSESDYVTCPGAPLDGRSFSISLWVRRRRGTFGHYCPVLSQEGLVLAFLANSFTFSFGDHEGGLFSSSTFGDTEWHHFCCTYDDARGEWAIFGNGVKVATDTKALASRGSGELMIGRERGFGANASIAEVRIWDRALREDEAKSDMWSWLTGTEPDLVGYWPLHDGTARDLSPRRAHGRLQGAPQPVALRHTIGGVRGDSIRSFTGEIADVRLWDRALSSREIKDGMNLLPTGKEDGLAAYYRLGAVAEQEDAAIVPDFSARALHARVYGAPYGGARLLSRATAGGEQAVRYSDDSLVAVQQLGVYEEQVEFRVRAGDVVVDPKVAAGPGKRLFKFGYWGKRSAGSDEVLRVPASCVQQVDFKPLQDGWHLASCRVTIPEGLSLLRVFGLADVTGEGWSAIEVRRHALRLISDCASRESYTDQVEAARIEGPTDTVLRPVVADELKVAGLVATIRDLVERIEIANNVSLYEAEQLRLAQQITASRRQLDDAKKALADEERHLGNHRMILKNVGTGHCVFPLSGHRWRLTELRPFAEDAREKFVLEGEYVDQDWCILRPATAPDHLILLDQNGRVCTVPQSTPAVVDGLERHLRANLRSGDRYSLAVRDRRALVLQANYDGSEGMHNVIGVAKGWDNTQQWTAELLGRTSVGAQRIQAAEASVARLEAAIREKQARIDALAPRIACREDPAALSSLLTSARTELTTTRSRVNQVSKFALGTLAAPARAAMTRVARDEQERITHAALLDFLRPVGGVQALATCEGHVQLAHVDARGRVLTAIFDAVADSRDTTFEQWIGAGNDRSSILTDTHQARLKLAAPIEVRGGAWTFEAWFYYPPVAAADGMPLAYNVFVGAADQQYESRLCIRDGNRLGTLVDGFFHDSGVNLDRVLAPGWHHAASVGRGDRTEFYLDGEAVGVAAQTRAALSFNGVDTYVEFPRLGQTFAEGITIEAWVYLDAAGQESTYRGIVTEAAQQFNLHVDGAAHQLSLTFAAQGTMWAVTDPRGLPQNRWVHVAATYDGQYLMLYRDGNRVAVSDALNIPLSRATSAWQLGGYSPESCLWRGGITEVRIWNTPHSVAEIRDKLYAQLVGDEPNLVHYWPMTIVEENGVQKVRDLGPSKKHGTVAGALEVTSLRPLARGSVAVLGNAVGGECPLGRLAEARLWRASLSPAELDAAGRLPVTGFEPELLAAWPMHEATGTRVADLVDGQHATLVGASWEACTAAIGNPGASVARLTGGARLSGPGPELRGRSFSIEVWARRERTRVQEFFLRQGESSDVNATLHVGFRANNAFAFCFCHNDLEVGDVGHDTLWHHWACTYDAEAQVQRVYRDGLLYGQRSAEPFRGEGDLVLGCYIGGDCPFVGQLAELRVWDHARTRQDIQENMRQRLSGKEFGLLGLWPLTAETAGKAHDRAPAQRHLALTRTVFPRTLDLPLAGGVAVAVAEYTTIGISADGAQQGLMRRCFGVAQGDGTRFVHDARVEALTLQWIGNAQFKPTLLGYIEGAPPVPSENLVYNEFGKYSNAATVRLTQTDEMQYRWGRSEATGAAFNMELFAGAAWSTTAGIGIQNKVAEGKLGGQGFYNYHNTTSESSAVTAGSTLTTSDSMTLRGVWETKPKFPHLGCRYVLRNVGYALVVSGLADVFVLKLQRSGRMVGYDVKPVEGMPLDVNTITFLINPTYTMNGSLDGLVGSSPADERFFGHVPAMRAQYGSLYPASYFRLKEAYDLAAEIERKDKERETFFMNFKATSVERGNFSVAADSNDYGGVGGDGEDKDREAAQSEVRGQAKEQEAKAKEETKRRKEQIAALTGGIDAKARAAGAFAEWQRRMESLLIRAGKRNIVNKYVWDADGGLRSESQSFANTVEHSVGCEISHEGGVGLGLDMQISSFKLELSLLGSGSFTQSSSKGLSQSKSLELSVDLTGVEFDGITALDDTPRQPGEKVDRYRMMTFYLEGDTRHFHDFFRTVVDPEWLISNDEEARALRQVQTGKPNRCWRVLHRVTYVERPALMGLGKDVRALKK